MKQLFYLIQLVALVAFSACDDYTTTEATPQSELTFNGTVLDFIDQGSYADYHFDSLRLVIDSIPGLRDTLSRPGSVYTLFATPDESFTSALSQLAEFRRGYGRGGVVSLRNLMIEPFVVIDTTITQTSTVVTDQGPVAVYDTTYAYRHYDYRESLRQLVGRYLFTRDLSRQNVVDLSYVSLLGHSMNMELRREDASGLTEAGTEKFSLIETRNSKQTTLWVRAEVAVSDIHCTNGCIHILSPRHEFGFNEITQYFNGYGNENK